MSAPIRILLVDDHPVVRSGIRAMLPHVDDFRPVHNLDSLADLITALSAPSAKRAA